MCEASPKTSIRSFTVTDPCYLLLSKETHCIVSKSQTRPWAASLSLLFKKESELTSLFLARFHSYNVSEKAGTVAVTVKRTGNLNQYAIVLCRTEQDSATSTSSVGSRPGQQDYVEYAGQVTRVKCLAFYFHCC